MSHDISHPIGPLQIPPENTKAMQEFPNLPFRVLVMQYIQHCGNRRVWTRDYDLCMDCLRPGHFVKQCRSLHCCRKCQKPHHTLLHVDAKVESPVTNVSGPPSPPDASVRPIPSHAASGLASNSLLMTCCILVDAPDGSIAEARTLLDCASSASFISERLTQSLNLPRGNQNTVISGVTGLSHKSPVYYALQYLLPELTR